MDEVTPGISGTSGTDGAVTKLVVTGVTLPSEELFEPVKQLGGLPPPIPVSECLLCDVGDEALQLVQ